MLLVGWDLVLNHGGLVAPDFYEITPRDWHGTVWFYAWVEQALARGVPIIRPDIVCAPGGQELGSSFPNWVDALMAVPLFRWFEFPSSYNLFTLLVPVFNTLAAFFALRAWTRRSWLAALVAVVYGFNVYAFEEISLGRTSTAVSLVVPLFLGAWARVLRRRGAGAVVWAVLAGAAGALAVHYHAFFAVGCVLVGAMMAAGAVLVPAPGVRRSRPLLAGLGVVVVGLFLVGPYFYQVGYLQGRLPLPDRHEIATLPRQGQAPWSPAVWSFVRVQVEHRLAREGDDDEAPALEAEDLERMRRDIQVVSLPVDFPLWGTVRTHRGTPRSSAWIFLLLTLGMGVAAGWRGLGWLAGCVLLYLVCLGPWACWGTNVPFEFVVRDGQALQLPLFELVDPLQDWVGFIKPLRLFPHFLFVTLLLLVLGMDRILYLVQGWAHDGAPGWMPARLRGLGGSPLRRRLLLIVASVLVPLLVCGPKLAQLLEPVPGFSRLAEYQPSPFFVELAGQPGGAIIELPLGLGHGASPQQLVHGRPRADAHADDFGALTAGQTPRKGCFAPGLVLDLWGYGCVRAEGSVPVNSRAPAVRPASAAPRIFTPGALRLAREQGFAWLVLYPEAYRALQTSSDEELRCDVEAIEASLVGVLGQPAYQDGQLSAWSLGAPEGADNDVPAQ